MNVRVLLLLAASALSGCSLSPLGGGAELDTTVTGSIAPAAPSPARPDPPLGYAGAPGLPAPEAAPRPRTATDGVAPSDWERIRLFASTQVETAKTGEVLDWTNPDTGSNGTISPLAANREVAGGRECRAFALTVSDVRGIRRYRGEACHTPDGMWQLFDVAPEDGALL